MAGISVAGVGSGLDLAGLLERLVAAERAAPALRYDRAESRAEAQLSALGTLKSALAELRTSVGALKALGAFGQLSAASSHEDLFTASADATALPNTYGIEVRALAAAHKLASGAFASAATVVGSGTLTIAVGGNPFSVSFAAGATLAAIRDAINGAADNTGVRASIVGADDGAHLLLASADTGTANALRVTRSGGDGGLDALVYDPGVLQNLAVKQAAADAVVAVDGFTRTSAGNVVTGAIGGVTLDLRKAAPGTTATLAVANDAAAVKAALEAFVAAYNKVVATVGTVSRYNPETKTAAPLAGDVLPRAVAAKLRGLLGGTVSGLADSLNALSDIGITAGQDGKLVINGATLDAALAANFGKVETLFTSANGYATRLEEILGELLDADGLVGTRESTLSARLARIADDRERLERRLDAMEARLRAQFTALDTLVAQMNTTAQFLAQQLGS